MMGINLWKPHNVQLIRQNKRSGKHTPMTIYPTLLAC